MDRHDRLSACKWTTEAMIAAQNMMEQADNPRDMKIGEAIFHLAYSLELILKDPRYSGGRGTDSSASACASAQNDKSGERIDTGLAPSQ